MRSALGLSRLTVALLLALAVKAADAGQYGRPDRATVVFSQTVTIGASTIQVDFADGTFDIGRAAIVERIQMAAHAVETYYGRFPVTRTRMLVIPVAGSGGVVQGTTWGNMGGFSAFLRLRIGQAVTRDELKRDWIITHELTHTALDSLPDDENWLEEGLASYVEPIARAQAGEVTTESVWASMVEGMPNGEPRAGDQGLNETHSWGRTYWGGALFCLNADVEIRRQTHNRFGLQDALRAIVAAGGTIDKELPVEDVLDVGDRATATHVLRTMFAEWSTKPVPVDLPALWQQLGVVETGVSVRVSDAAPLAGIRRAITATRH